MSLTPLDCTHKCRSLQHAQNIVAALTNGSDGQLRAFLSAYCHNSNILRDDFGRTSLHMVASLGKKALLEWLLENKYGDLTVKDKESGWTPLHRSAFYGHIHCLIPLVKHGGLLSTQDKEGLSVLDLTMKDRPAHVVFKNTDPTEVYTWGNNANFTLGHGNQESRQHPEIVDVFARTGVYIKQVVLCKFHSVFLSQKGQVYTCGHGQGGRLGHGDEQTYLVPRLVEGLMSHHCSQVAAAKDHTVVLTEEGYVFTFGLNTFYQLGLGPPPVSVHVPKQVFSRMLKGKTAIGVAAGRFHTVLWTREAVYTVGLNGGQLGYLLDPNGEKCVTALRQVSALHHKDVTIAMAAASDAATVAVTEKGDVYLLADFQCKKIASRLLNIRKVVVSGGCLDHRVDPQVLNAGGGEKAVILALDEAGRVFCWRSSGTSARQCRWAYGRQVFMSDIALSENSMMFVTQEGEGFSGAWAGEYKKYSDKKVNVENPSHSDGVTQYERIRLEKLASIHRAVSITVDSKGLNFGVLQSDPKTRLDGVKYEHGKIIVTHKKQGNKPKFCQRKCSYLCDVTLKSEDGKEFPCHKSVLCARLEYFNSMLGNPWIEASSCNALELPISSEILQVILEYIYTDECPTIKECLKVEFVCSVLVVADQLLITRLKEMCEVVITEHLTLKNAAVLLEFAALYNAEQLKLSCLQFIGLNITALLESKALDILSDEVLLDVSAAYRQMVPAMQKRIITPYHGAPDLSFYVHEDLDSAFNLKPDSGLDQSSRCSFQESKDKGQKETKPHSCLHVKYLGFINTYFPLSVGSQRLMKSDKANSTESLQELLTSDSEGSCMGLGSPREMQSPVFTERSGGIVKRKLCCVILMDIIYSLFTLATLNEFSLLFCSVSSSIKHSPVTTKLSQKQRKMLALASKEANVEATASKPTPTVTPSKSTGKAWLVRANMKTTVFLLILQRLPWTMTVVFDSTFILSKRPLSPQSLISTLTLSLPFCLLINSLRPWVLGATSGPPPCSLLTFAAIVEEEKQQEAALIRSREKPLALIQIEERAIQDLLLHYKAHDNPDELIVVERSSKGPMAVPTWNKH
uniref:Inhibitor of Bruton tyrosine kinase n=1 Tax=Cynoglossus semilaevis TaxID=244447 RepID=A0A3P8VIF4_CYNSE